jgi:hypothetical protein
MDDQALREAVVWLYARDYGLRCPVPGGDLERATPEGEAALRTRCRQALWDRLVSGRVDLRLWTSRLARELFLSEEALERGLGLEDACDFWIWFDRTMWLEAVVREPSSPSPISQLPPTSSPTPLRPVANSSPDTAGATCTELRPWSRSRRTRVSSGSGAERSGG